MKRIYFLLFAGAMLLSCQKSSVDKKEDGILRYKESVAINDIPRATLTFFDVTDNRCPEGIQCFVAGNARVDLTLDGVTTEGRITKHVKMCLGDCSNFVADTINEEFAGNKYQFILKSVSPFPKKDMQSVKAEYNISLEIKKK